VSGVKQFPSRKSAWLRHLGADEEPGADLVLDLAVILSDALKAVFGFRLFVFSFGSGKSGRSIAALGFGTFGDF